MTTSLSENSMLLTAFLACADPLAARASSTKLCLIKHLLFCSIYMRGSKRHPEIILSFLRNSTPYALL